MRAVAASIRRAVARAIEESDCSLFSRVAPAWSDERLDVRGRVVGVVGATLGGSWKTPVAIALARRLSRETSVAFLCHAYGNSLRTASVVDPADGRFGDEARLAATALGERALVVAGPTRRDASALARADVVVADGFRGAAWRRVLALDGERPFGGADARARRDELTSAADAVVACLDRLASPSPDVPESARVTRYDLTLPDGVAGARVAIVTAIARPSRFVRALARRGVSPVLRVEFADHGDPSAVRRAHREVSAARADVVLVTEKCAFSLPRSIGGARVVPVPLVLDVPSDFLRS